MLATAFGALAGVALWQRLDIGFGGPSLDETSGLYVGRLLHHHIPWRTYAYATSSQIPLHLFGVSEHLGGLWGARVMSALLSACSLGFFFGGMRALFGSARVAGWATLLLALQAPHLYAGKIATDDVVAVFFFTGSMWLLIEGLGQRHCGWLWCALASVGFAAAVLSQYVVLVHGPILLMLVAMRRPRLLVAAMAPCTLLLADYLRQHWSELQALAHHQLALLAGTSEPRLEVLREVARYTAPMLALALASLAIQMVRVGVQWRALRLHLFLLLLAAPLIGLHVSFASREQLPLHLIYPLIALTPLAAWLLHRSSRRHLVLALSAAVILAGLGLVQTRQLEAKHPRGTLELGKRDVVYQGSFVR